MPDYSPLTKKILLNRATPYDKFQEEYFIINRFREYAEDHHCLECGILLYNHDWRDRYVIDEFGRTFLIKIQRKRCPKCKRTYTILPAGVHAFKQHAIKVIADVIDSFLEYCKFLSVLFLFVDRKLKAKWVKDFLNRYRKTNQTHDTPEKVERTPYFAAPKRLIVAKDREEVLDAIKRSTGFHHLYLIPFT